MWVIWMWRKLFMLTCSFNGFLHLYFLLIPTDPLKEKSRKIENWGRELEVGNGVLLPMEEFPRDVREEREPEK